MNASALSMSFRGFWPLGPGDEEILAKAHQESVRRAADCARSSVFASSDSRSANFSPVAGFSTSMCSVQRRANPQPVDVDESRIQAGVLAQLAERERQECLPLLVLVERDVPARTLDRKLADQFGNPRGMAAKPYGFADAFTVLVLDAGRPGRFPEHLAQIPLVRLDTGTNSGPALVGFIVSLRGPCLDRVAVVRPQRLAGRSFGILLATTGLGLRRGGSAI